MFLQPWMTTTTAHGFEPWKWLYAQRWRLVSLMVQSRNQPQSCRLSQFGESWFHGHGVDYQRDRSQSAWKHLSRINCSRHLDWSWRTICSDQRIRHSSIMAHHMPPTKRFWHEYNKLLHPNSKAFSMSLMNSNRYRNANVEPPNLKPKEMMITAFIYFWMVLTTTNLLKSNSPSSTPILSHHYVAFSISFNKRNHDWQLTQKDTLRLIHV